NIRFDWSSPSQTRQLVPQTQLFPTAPAARLMMPEANQMASFKVYPNPGNQQVTIDWSDIATSEVGIALVNAKGETVYTTKENLKNNHDLNATALKPGVYVILLKTDKTVLKQRMVIIR
ncbi:MAG: T9SS type A sorting domain-containing protein, partial [Bacteroidota bacterium]